MRVLPDDDERLLLLGTLRVREGQFAPGPGSAHALNQFAGTSPEACDRFPTALVQIARDDALTRARACGHLPPRGARCGLGAVSYPGVTRKLIPRQRAAGPFFTGVPSDTRISFRFVCDGRLCSNNVVPWRHVGARRCSAVERKGTRV